MEADLLLKQVGIKPSRYRRAIYEYLESRKDHPSAEMIFHALKEKYPYISLATIYNTLNTFADSGLINSMRIEHDKTRFDADTSNHYHFRCQQCGQVMDVMADELLLQINGRNIRKCRVDNVSVNLYGTCADCSGK